MPATTKKMKLSNWEDLRAELLSPEQLAEVGRQVAAELAKIAEDEEREAAQNRYLSSQQAH